jgi:uncharacterized RDD family membrane protein YckC
MENAIAFGILALVILLLAQRWIWVIIFFLGGAAALIATLVSIFYSEILVALGFLLLWLICWIIMVAISNGYTPGKRHWGSILSRG